MTREEYAREVLERHGLEVTAAGAFMHRANVAIGPTLLAAMLDFAASERRAGVAGEREKQEGHLRCFGLALMKDVAFALNEAEPPHLAKMLNAVARQKVEAAIRREIGS